MKKKTLLIFLLTAVSSATVVAAAGCDNSGHQHSWSYKYDAANHWQECSGCSETKGNGAHDDKKNNQTGEQTPDGKCDECGLESIDVTFDVQGHGTAPTPKKIWKGGKVDNPGTLSASGLSFGGWYKEAACENEFDFNGEITKTTTIYAKWNAEVTFYTYGKCTAPEQQNVKVGGVATEPEKPVDKDVDYVFEGWYTDEEFQNKFDFTTPVTEHLELYANWEADTRPAVTFNMLGHGTAPKKQRVEEGGKATNPGEPAEIDFWLFKGWYKEEACENEFDFTAETISGDTVVYAKWDTDPRAVITWNVHGYGTAPEKVKLEKGTLLTKPTDPTATDVNFGGWYTDEECTQAFDFTSPVTDHVELHAKWTVTVTFDLQGYGTAIDSAEAWAGHKYAKPEDPTDDNMTFYGWYEEAGCVNEYDFNTNVTKAVTLYAKWVPVGSVELELEALSANKSLSGSDKVYFVYKAEEEGRYWLSPSNSAKTKCTYTTDLSETDGVTYGANCDLEEVYFDLNKGQTVVITVSLAAGNDSASAINFTLNKATNEPLPADKFLDGLYANTSSNLLIDRTAGKVTYGSFPACSYTYLGGKTDTLYFTLEAYDTDFELSYNDGVYSLKQIGGGSPLTLNYFAKPSSPVTVDKFSGVYKPATGSGVDEITEVHIGDDGKGHYIQNDSKYSVDYPALDETYGVLTFSQYLITVNNETITVYKNNGSSAVYTKTGEYLSPKLPLKESTEYVGSEYTINISSGGTQWLGEEYSGPYFNVVDYDDTSKVYTVDTFDWMSDSQTGSYKLKIENDGAVIKLYSATDTTYTTPLDTLTKFAFTYHDLPTAGTSATQVNTADFQKGVYLLEVTQTSWYEFTKTEIEVNIFYNVSEDSLQYGGTEMVFSDGSALVYLEKGTIVKINTSYGEDELPDTVSFTSKAVATPLGYGEDNPILATGSATVENSDGSTTYYVTYTAPAAGEYLVTATYINGFSQQKYAHFTINGKEYGYKAVSAYYGQWVEDSGMDDENVYTKLTVTEGQVVKFTIDRLNTYDIYDLTLVIMEDLSSGTELDLPQGTATSTVSENGTYTAALSAVDGATAIKFTSNSDFTIVCEGKSTTAQEVTLTAAQLKLGFNVTGTDITYQLIYKAGSQYNPLKITELGANTGVTIDNYVEITAPEGGCTVMAGSLEGYYGYDYFYFTYNETDYGYNYQSGKYVDFPNKVLKVAGGQKVLISVHCAKSSYDGGYVSLVVGKDLTEGAVALDFTLSTDKVGNKVNTAKATVNGSKNFYIASMNEANMTVSGTAAFKLVYADGTEVKASDVGYSVYVYAQNDLYFQIVSETEQEITFLQTFEKGSEQNPYEIDFNGGSSASIEFENDAYVKLPAGTYTASGNYVSFELNGNEISGSFTVEEGDLLYCDLWYRGYPSEITFSVATGGGNSGSDTPVGEAATYTDGSVTLEVNADFTEATFIAFGETNSCTFVSKNGNVYSYRYWGNVSLTVTVSADGNTVTVVDGYDNTSYNLAKA